MFTNAEHFEKHFEKYTFNPQLQKYNAAVIYFAAGFYIRSPQPSQTVKWPQLSPEPTQV